MIAARQSRGFTLVEVILAILIISAIMTVLLYFYQRSVEVRQNVLEETDYLSVSRMFLEQLTTELRSARIVEDQFIGMEGSSNSITFVTTGIPVTARWITSTNDASVFPPVTDLKRVTYKLLAGTNVFDIRGIDRTEDLLTTAAFTAGTNSTEFVNAAGTNILSETDTNLLSTNDVQLIRRPLTDRIKTLQFRYWGGTNWLDSWSRLELPGGVEITIGKDPAPPEAAPTTTTAESTGPEESSPDLFRRVVYLPNSVPPANKVVVPESNDIF